MSKKLNVLFVMSSNSGTAYWRLYNWWVAGHRTGALNCHVLGWEKDLKEIAPWQYQIHLPEFSAQLTGQMNAAVRAADIVIFQYVHTEVALRTIYALKDMYPDKPILAEIDDDITDVATYNVASNCYVPGSQVMKSALGHFEVADAMIVSTPYLKEVYSDRNENIYVMPNSIDVPKWTSTRRKSRPGIRIGWAGGNSHDGDLSILETVIPKVLAAHKDVEFVFVSSQLPAFLKDQKRVKLIKKWARIDKYPQHLADMDFDIGLAPLVDNKFNRAKSNLRWLEYSALGIPTVASRVGHFAETVRDGVDGLLCDGPDDFVAAIDRLVRDKKERRKIANAARQRMADDFNVDKQVAAYATILEEVVARGAIRQAPSMMNGVEEAPAEPEMSPLQVLAEHPMVQDVLH